VNFQASPPLIGSIYSCGAGGRADAPLGGPAGASGERTKTSHLPSGDQRGEASCLPSVIRRGGSSPRTETLQMEVSYPSFLSLTETLTKATRVPSGEIVGSPIQLNWKISFSVMERFWASARKEIVARDSNKVTSKADARCMAAP